MYYVFIGCLEFICFLPSVGVAFPFLASISTILFLFPGRIVATSAEMQPMKNPKLTRGFKSSIASHYIYIFLYLQIFTLLIGLAIYVTLKLIIDTERLELTLS